MLAMGVARARVVAERRRRRDVMKCMMVIGVLGFWFFD